MINTLRFKALAFAVLLTTGCTTTFSNSGYSVKQTAFMLKIYEAPHLGNPGLARWKAGYCEIYLKEYPRCLQHEIRHCTEGHWHDHQPNGEDC